MESRKANRFSALADLAYSSESEQEEEVQQEPKQEQRTWKEFRPTTARFSKPKQDIHFLPDEDSAPKNRMMQPLATPPIMTSTNTFPSLLSRNTSVATVQQTETAERSSAMAWAEKVKQSLEKAEAARKPAAPYQPSEDFIASLGKLSFFRRGASTASSSEG